MQITVSVDEAKFMVLKQLGLDAKLYSKDGVALLLVSQHAVKIVDTLPLDAALDANT